MPYPRFEIEDIGVVEVGEIATTEITNSSFEIPPDYFKACYNGHVVVVKVSYSVLIFPKSLHFSHYIISATLRTMHDLNTPCDKPGLIVDDEDYYQVEARFNRLYREDPFAELDDFIAELERQNGKPASGDPAPQPQPPQPNPQPPAGANPPPAQPAPAPAPAQPEETPETEAERRAREELERARERARELEEGNEQVFINPDNDWMEGVVASRHKNSYNGIQVHVNDFTWLERPGRIIPYPSKDYFDLLQGGERTYALRYTYSFAKKAANIENLDLDTVNFKVSTIPVVIGDSGIAALGANPDQATLKKAWTQTVIDQLAAIPGGKPKRLEKLSDAQKEALLAGNVSTANFAPELKTVTSVGQNIATAFVNNTSLDEPAAGMLGLDLAVTAHNFIRARMADAINNCGC